MTHKIHKWDAVSERLDEIIHGEVKKFQDYPFQRLKDEDIQYFFKVGYATESDIENILSDYGQDLRQIWPEGAINPELKKIIIAQYENRIKLLQGEIQTTADSLRKFQLWIPKKRNIEYPGVRYKITERPDLSDAERRIKNDYEDVEKSLNELRKSLMRDLTEFQNFHYTLARSLTEDEISDIRKALIILYFGLENSAALSKIPIHNTGSSQELFWILYFFVRVYDESSFSTIVSQKYGAIQRSIKAILKNEYSSIPAFIKDVNRVESVVRGILGVLKERADIIFEIEIQRKSQEIFDDRVGKRAKSGD
jgi:hypothetical protein